MLLVSVIVREGKKNVFQIGIESFQPPDGTVGFGQGFKERNMKILTARHVQQHAVFMRHNARQTGQRAEQRFQRFGGSIGFQQPLLAGKDASNQPVRRIIRDEMAAA